MRGHCWQREHTNDPSAAAAGMAGVLWPGGRTWLRKNVVGEASCFRGLLTGLPASILPPPSVGHTAECPFSTTAVTPRGSCCPLNQDLLWSPSHAVRAFLVLRLLWPHSSPVPSCHSRAPSQDAALALLPLYVGPSCSFHLGCPSPSSLRPETQTDVLSPPSLTSTAELSHLPLSAAEA